MIDAMVIAEIVGDLVAKIFKMLAEGNGASIWHDDAPCHSKLVVLRVLTQSLCLLAFLLWFGGQREGGGGGFGWREGGFLEKPGRWEEDVLRF